MSKTLIFVHFSDNALERALAEIAKEEDHLVRSYRTWRSVVEEVQSGATPDLLFIDSVSLAASDEAACLDFFQSRPQLQVRIIGKPGDRSFGKRFEGLQNVQVVNTSAVNPGTEDPLRTLLRRASRRDFCAERMQRSTGSYSQANCAGNAPSEMVLEELDENRFFLALSPAMLELYRQVTLLRDIDVSVLILGESGTGKEIVAQLLHKYSCRANKKFVNVNCAALPLELLESELFGHMKGAFTGAISDKPGRFEQANGGTILLDEIGEISAAMQAKLLHVLQDGQFTRLGARQPTRVDVHVLAATNISIEEALAAKTFREDLYYRLNTFTFNVPPLRERAVEIPYLVNEMIARTPLAMKTGITHFSQEILDLMPHYSWPGNLRELRNFVIRAVIMQDEKASREELEIKIARSRCGRKRNDEEVQPYSGQVPMRSVVRDVRNRTESRLIEDALHANSWNRRNTARALNISYRALLYKIDQYGLNPRKQGMTSQSWGAHSGESPMISGAD